ncbi:MAG: redoxin domain-containing protein [bacterium]
MINDPIKVGEQLPDFTLFDHNKEKINIADFRGKKLLLSFHPLAWTNICAQQMKSLEVNKKRFDELNTVAFGLSIDSVPSKKAWAEKELGIKNTRLLSDFWPHGEIAKKLGIFREKDGFSERVNIIVDENQRVIFIKIYDISKLPDIEEIVTFLKNNREKK